MTNHIAALLLPLVLTLPDQGATNYPLSCNGTSPTSDIGSPGLSTGAQLEASRA